MNNQENIKPSTKNNLLLWLSVASLMFGIFTLTGFVQIFPEPIAGKGAGVILIMIAAILFISPYKEIKREMKNNYSDKKSN